MKKIKLTQGTPEWKEFRRLKIGASDSPIICGVSFFKTPTKLWEEKIKAEDCFVSEAMKKGTDLEPHIRKMVEDKHWVTYEPIVVQHEKYDWMIASLDGYDEQNNKIIEIKTTNENAFIDIRFTKKIPEIYRYQMQHQMEVTGLDECTLIFSNGTDFVEIVEKRDDKIIGEILEKGKEFYDSLVNFSFPKSEFEEREDLAPLLIQAMNIKQEMSILEKHYSMVLKQIKDKCNERSISGGGVKLSKYYLPGRIDYASIPELTTIDLEKYRKQPTECWRLS